MPSRSTKLGEDVTNHVKCNKHLVFITKRFIQNSACVYHKPKKIAPHVRKNRGDAIYIAEIPQ